MYTRFLLVSVSFGPLDSFGVYREEGCDTRIIHNTYYYILQSVLLDLG